MPTLTAATDWLSGRLSIVPASTSLASASCRATKPAGDRGAAGPAVGLQDVAVDVDRALAERLEVDHPAQRATDQPLDLDAAPVLLARG